jgi:hypothetical protein
MSMPEFLNSSSEQSEKAATWLRDARAAVECDERAGKAERRYFLDYLDVAEGIAGAYEPYEAELARRQTGRETSRIDVPGVPAGLLPVQLDELKVAWAKYCG